MLPKVTTYRDLEVQIFKDEIFNQLVAQVNKDFSLIGIDFQFKEIITLKEFLQQFNSIIIELIDNNFELFLNLLYRIDLSENKIKTIIKNNSDSFYAKVSFEILKREWQKVWFRLNYGN